MDSVRNKVNTTLYGFEKMVCDKVAHQVGDEISHPVYIIVGEQVRNKLLSQMWEEKL